MLKYNKICKLDFDYTMGNGILYSNEDTIAAVSTAYGEGGIGIVRISGPDSLSVLKKLFRFGRYDASGVIGDAADDAIAANGAEGIGPDVEFESRHMYYGHIIDPESGDMVDEVLAVYMKGPHTYTCEDVVEINGHGSVAALRKILALTLSNGARMAEPGEFTRRAFLGGRLDLSQAEAVMDLIEAETDGSLSAAASQLSGRLSARIHELRKDLMDILVDMAVNMDYPDEDIEEIVYGKLSDSLNGLIERIRVLLATADTGRLLKDGLKVAIVGRPNVGKSSLLNALTGMERAIVTHVPGTTRDTITETIDLGGIPVRIMDTAGIRETSDEIERIGIERSRASVQEADLVFFVVDGSDALTDEDREIAKMLQEAGKKTLLLLNKQDLGGVLTEEDAVALLPGANVKLTQLRTGAADEGRVSEVLEELVRGMVYSGSVKQKDAVMVTGARHEALLTAALQGLTDAAARTAEGEPLDLIEIDVHEAYDALGEIIGEAVAGDVVDQVFARFCLGK